MARREPQTLDQLLPRVLARLAEQTGKGHSLTPVWNAAVGPHIARHSRPLSLEAGTLVVSVASGEWVHTLTRQEGALDRKSTRLNSSHSGESRMPSSA